MSEHSGKGKPGTDRAAPKKSGGGFWSTLVDTFVGAYVQASAERARGAADPVERMEPVRQERQETGRELVFRTTDGAAGQAPRERIDRERRHIARSVAGRAGGTPTIPGGTGAPLPGAVRRRMEPALGADLSGVRVHTAGDSAEAATALGARAFTVGNDVHFGAGQFAPGSKEGDKLLAHELTHVVQGQKSGVQRKADAPEHQDGGHEVSHPDEPAEKEADAVGDKVADQLHGGSAPGHGHPPEAAQKKEPHEAAPAVATKRIDPIGAAPPKLFRATKKPDLGPLTKVRQSVVRTINNDIKALFNNNTIKKSLDRDEKTREKRLAERKALETELATLEKQYEAMVANPTAPDALKEKYETLKANATALLDTLKDYSLTAEERVKEADKARAEIAGNKERAKKQVPSLDLKVLQLETYKGLKTALQDGFADVERRIGEDEAEKKELSELRKDKVAADQLRRDAERAAKLSDVDKAIQPFIDKIDDICLNTTKAGRDAATVGDGSSEAAAIEEAKTGKQTAGCWHGPKCRMEANGLGSAIKALREHTTLTDDKAILARIDEAIKKAETRKAGLESGAAAWESSKYKNLAK